MNSYRPSSFSILPFVVKNLLIINGLCFLANVALDYRFHIDLNELFGLYYPISSEFKPYQLITHVFMHGSMMHLFFNMFSLWMFGSVLENYWGPQRFFIYYFVTALGAAIIHTSVNYIQFRYLSASIDSQQMQQIITEGRDLLKQGMNYTMPSFGNVNLLINIPTVGASGAVFGLLLAFGMLFPNQELLMLFLPIPIKAKYFVILYGALELFQGISNSPGDNVAHFAHLGGMLFGFILIKLWNKNKSRFY
jgi:membrane associated rhomboid family serine protease